MKLEQAKEIAGRVVDILTPVSHYINIAGCIRREKPEIKEIDIVCSPHRDIDIDLFGNITGYFMTHKFEELLKLIGTETKRSSNSRYIAIEYNGQKINLFLPLDYDYFRQYALRTGSNAFSALVIARGWRDLGWVSTTDGLRLESQCILNPENSSWTCNKVNPKLPPKWESEEAFLNWLGIGYVPPQNRDISTANEQVGNFLLKLYGHYTPTYGLKVDEI